jgi:toxin ParE1/3/4
VITVWSALARADLLAIVDYLLEVNPTAAVDTEQRIIEAIGQLADFPGLGRPGRVAGSRELVITGTPYIAVYRVRRDAIEILRMLHGARKWPETI